MDRDEPRARERPALRCTIDAASRARRLRTYRSFSAALRATGGYGTIDAFRSLFRFTTRSRGDAMQLIGMMDSPYVRRVAIALHVLGLPFEHRGVSVFRHFHDFEKINPVVKAPTLVDEDGTLLIDSTLILDYLDHQVPPPQRLLPDEPHARRFALAVVGFALAACEKTVQQVYERQLRPADRQHEPWFERVRAQMHAAYGALEPLVAGSGGGWLCADRMTQADITAAVAWRFTQHTLPGELDAARYPALAALSARLEVLPAFIATPLE